MNWMKHDDGKEMEEDKDECEGEREKMQEEAVDDVEEDENVKVGEMDGWTEEWRMKWINRKRTEEKDD